MKKSLILWAAAILAVSMVPDNANASDGKMFNQFWEKIWKVLNVVNKHWKAEHTNNTEYNRSAVELKDKHLSSGLWANKKWDVIVAHQWYWSQVIFDISNSDNVILSFTTEDGEGLPEGCTLSRKLVSDQDEVTSDHKSDAKSIEYMQGWWFVSEPARSTCNELALKIMEGLDGVLANFDTSVFDDNKKPLFIKWTRANMEDFYSFPTKSSSF